MPKPMPIPLPIPIERTNDFGSANSNITSKLYQKVLSVQHIIKTNSIDIEIDLE